MFIDRIKLTFSAGRGGDGVVSWTREKFLPKGGPSGGNGGRGGSIILEVDPQLTCLQSFRHKHLIKADNGKPGGSGRKQGARGKDLTLKIPAGTLVKDAKTRALIFEGTLPDQEWTICKGGRGGMGNHCFKSPTHQAPEKWTAGQPGEKLEVELELKLIADVGLIGMPNAGKSSLLSQIAHVALKIGAYPFTTIHPNLSTLQFEDHSRITLADIPGIIEKAHANKGLGLAFLRHIERTSTLIYVIDASGIEGRDPIDDFRILRSELEAYDPRLLNKPSVIALNKTDLEETQPHVERFRKQYPDATIFETSALLGKGLGPLIQAVRSLVQSK